MEKSGINSGGKVLAEEKISALKNYITNPEQKDFLISLIDKLKQISKNLKDKVISSTVIELSVILENSTPSVKDKLYFFNEKTQINFENSILGFNEYFSELNSMLEKIADFELKNSAFFKEVFIIYAIEISKILEDSEIKSLNFQNENLSSSVDSTEKYPGISKDQIFLISKSINESFYYFFEKYYSWFYATISNLTKLIQITPGFNFPDNIDDSNSIVLPDNYLKELNLLLEKYTDNFKSEFESCLGTLFQNFDCRIEESVYHIFINENNRLSLVQIPDLINLSNLFKSSIEQILSKTLLIQKSFFNELNLELQLEKVKLNLFFNIQILHFQLFQIIQNGLGNKNEKLISDIQLTIENYNLNQIPDIANVFDTKSKLAPDIYNNIENRTENFLNEIKNQLITISEKIELFKSFNYHEFALDAIDQNSLITVLARKITDDLIHGEIFSLLKSSSVTLSHKLNEIDNEILNQNRLIEYSIFSTDHQQNISFTKNIELDVLKLLNHEQDIARQNKEKIENISKPFSSDLVKVYKSLDKNLNINYFKREAGNLRQYIPKKKSRMVFTRLKNFSKAVSNISDKLIDKFWSNQSEAHIIADDLMNKQQIKSSINQILNLVEPLRPNEQLNSELPFYYKHLFIEKSNFNNEFWMGRTKELDKAQIAHRRFLSGNSGALLITGERFSGKSFMARYLSLEIMKSKTIIIDAPESDSIDSKTLLKKIQESSGFKGDFSKVFNSVEANTIVVFEDLELWWEKSEAGNQIIQQIFEIIEQFGKKIFFIVTINAHALKPIEKLNPLQNLFLDIIYCKPLNSKLLQSIVLFRHQASGLKFGFKLNVAKTEESFKSKTYSKLFSKYFKYSGGNIGVCLMAWISNIVKLEGNRLIMKLPEPVNISELEVLEKDEILLLHHLVIHKKMNLAKISRVLLLQENIVIKQLNYLVRTGLVTGKDSVYELNQYINHLIVRFLKNQDML